jgi:hypothetical protein
MSRLICSSTCQDKHRKIGTNLRKLVIGVEVNGTLLVQEEGLELAHHLVVELQLL